MDQLTPVTMTQAKTNSQSSATNPNGPRSQYIGGVLVEFPTKPYPSQLAMMSKVIECLKKRQNGLFESPTGSGKSLALLCSAIAWQRQEAARVEAYNAKIDSRNEAIDNGRPAKLRRLNGSPSESVDKDSTVEKSNEAPLNLPAPQNSIITISDDEDFVPSKISQKTQSVSESSQINEVRERKVKKNDFQDYQFEPPEKKLTVPKIYFGTRTHKQIAQITRELRKTVYRDSRSVILASRDHTCVNPVVASGPNKNEKCKDLQDHGEGCGWHQNSKRLGTFAGLQSAGVKPGYDLEDLVKAGKKNHSCPYYATRNLLQYSDIIFCPYNYLIDPNIRKSMSIELDNQIVILDEAHNMEDASREAASFTIDILELEGVMKECEKLAGFGIEPYAHNELAKFASTISGWITDNSKKLRQIDLFNSEYTMTGTDVEASMMNIGIDKDSIKEYATYFTAVNAKKEQGMEHQRGKREPIPVQALNTASTNIIEKLLRMFDQLQRENGLYRDDYRLAIKISHGKQLRQGKHFSGNIITMDFWCLNPAIAFQEVRDKVHAIVLTSGTLSPMNSFESELGTPFKLKLEAPHVIDKNQVWASVVGVGPTGKNLNGAYTNASTFTYQDEVGNVVLDICKEMPGGILCFFSSYRVMDNMQERWSNTGTLSKIFKHKDCYFESRGGGNDFLIDIGNFYESVETHKSQKSGKTGAIFFAVTRGKASEGLDFADDNARAVICVGIPFPAFKDVVVKSKREYNDQNKKKGLLSGSEWYEIQAFRGLNQALGRCIRHRHDWGAIFLVDSRFSNRRYTNSLSKWIRNDIKYFANWDAQMSSFRMFKEEMSNKDFIVQDPFSISQNGPSNTIEAQDKVLFYGIRLNDGTLSVNSEAPTMKNEMDFRKSFSTYIETNPFRKRENELEEICETMEFEEMEESFSDISKFPKKMDTNDTTDSIYFPNTSELKENNSNEQPRRTLYTSESFTDDFNSSDIII